MLSNDLNLKFSVIAALSANMPWSCVISPFRTSSEFRKGCDSVQWMAHVTPLGFTGIWDTEPESDTASLIGQCVPARSAKAGPSFWWDTGMWDMWPRRDSGEHFRWMTALQRPAPTASAARLLQSVQLINLSFTPAVYDLHLASVVKPLCEPYTLRSWHTDWQTWLCVQTVHQHTIWSTSHLILAKTRPLTDWHRNGPTRVHVVSMCCFRTGESDTYYSRITDWCGKANQIKLNVDLIFYTDWLFQKYSETKAACVSSVCVDM